MTRARGSGVVDHVARSDPRGLARLLDALQKTGAQEQAATLAARDVADSVHLAPRHPFAALSLVTALQDAREGEQADALAARIADEFFNLLDLGSPVDSADSAARDDTDALYDQLSELRDLRLRRQRQQVTALAERIAAQILQNPGADPGDVAALLKELRRAGEQDQIAAMLGRGLTARVCLGNPDGVARLLTELRASAEEQVTPLAERIAAEAPLDDPGAVTRLLTELRLAGAPSSTSNSSDRPSGTTTRPTIILALLPSCCPLCGERMRTSRPMRWPPAPPTPPSITPPPSVIQTPWPSC